MAFSFINKDQLKQLNISEEEYKAILCKAWDKWRQAVFSGKSPQDAILAAQNHVNKRLAKIKAAK